MDYCVDNRVMKIIKSLQIIAESRLYWLVHIIGGVALLATALVSQYVFEEYPCVVCIQIRLWISLLVLVSIGGLILRKMLLMNSVMQLGVVIASIGFVERSYLLLGTEKGFIFGDCGFSLGLPAWFAIDQWVPWAYQVEAACGYTPEIIFGITMAEALIVISVGLSVVSVVFAFALLAGLVKRA